MRVSERAFLTLKRQTRLLIFVDSGADKRVQQFSRKNDCIFLHFFTRKFHTCYWSLAFTFHGLCQSFIVYYKWPSFLNLERRCY